MLPHANGFCSVAQKEQICEVYDLLIGATFGKIHVVGPNRQYIGWYYIEYFEKQIGLSGEMLQQYFN